MSRTHADARSDGQEPPERRAAGLGWTQERAGLHSRPGATGHGDSGCRAWAFPS